MPFTRTWIHSFEWLDLRPRLEKHVINAPGELVVDSLEGLCALNPGVALDSANKVVYQKYQDRSKVALICGGGSGHEPAHAGFVGKGMLTAAVCGNIFASPNASQVKHAINLVDNSQGTLIIVKNYTGDVLCFGLSREQYLATHPEKHDKVRFLIVGDDVAVGRTQGSIVGRRGLAGTVLVYKIAGAMAEMGSSLDETYSVAEWVGSRLVTIGCGLEHCHVPGTGHAESNIKEHELEIGLGIHNEPGVETVSPIPSRKELINRLVNMLTSTTDPERSFVPFSGKGGEQVVLMVNNLGGMSELELGGIAREAVTNFTARRINVERLLVGAFMTSLNMPGFSLTCLLLPMPSDNPAGPIPTSRILELLDHSTESPGWKWNSALPPVISSATVLGTSTTSPFSSSNSKKIPASNPSKFDQAVKQACEAVISGESELTRLDSIVGDGDCGLTLKSGAEVVLNAVVQGEITGEDVLRSIVNISHIAEEKMGGTSGALYSIFFSALAQSLPSSVSTSHVVDTPAWSESLSSALMTLFTYTRARPPSRTLIDPLTAFVLSLKGGSSVDVAVREGVKAADDTADIEAAKAGRSAYVESKHLKGIADPGAVGVKLILEAIGRAIST